MKYSEPPSWPDLVISCVIAKSMCRISPNACCKLLGDSDKCIRIHFFPPCPRKCLTTGRVLQQVRGAASHGVTSDPGVSFPALSWPRVMHLFSADSLKPRIKLA